MSEHESLIIKFYSSFQALDVDGMKSCYHSEIVFSDPAFPKLNGPQAGGMWTMLIDALKKNKEGWNLSFSQIEANDQKGSCTWEAHYTFSATGRKVHNIIHAEFRFKDGKIIHHTDRFDFYRWARMAFGVTGFFLGWMPFFKKKVQTTVARRLAKSMSPSVS